MQFCEGDEMCSEVRFRRAISGWLVGCATVTAVIYVLLLGFLASGPGGHSIKSIGAGIYIALVPPAIILVITRRTGIADFLVPWPHRLFQILANSLPVGHA